MKLKSLLFGSAAVIAAGTGAQAADLPIVEPVEYVRICDAFGAGFYYIPGTDTCLKIGGYVRAESHWVNGDSESLEALYNDDDEDVNNWTTRARGQVNLDARTETDFGLVRSYIALEMTVGPGATTTDASNDDAGYAGTGANLAAAFIQVSNDWGTYTAGHTGSFFDFFGSNGWGTRLNTDDPTGEQTLFAWTFAGGNGFSFTLSAEDPSTGSRRFAGDDDYGGQEAPDGVANIRVDQGWGSAQIMGAVRQFHDDVDDDDHEIGFAVGAGLSLGIPGGWSLDAQGGYAEGALRYVTTDPHPDGSVGDWDDGEDANEAWSVRAGINGPLFANLNAWLDGSYTDVEEDDDGDSYEFWAAKAGAAWTPTPGLVMGPEVAFNHFEEDDVDDTSDSEYDVWGVMWRVQRSF